ncbi:uncharacterized protein MONOS_8568 [Monocercomonoides exilis]|uniref:uncharacterized protein n=1 Tax=Monocercomonoides exilis TaxID=2049356 RepID=UPI003559CB98|nr:hypothetical protein MONOS_8568 [Monocercomonoides exilis]|eukprot:MONOS_8568.1-p1 / transcript=MONOS_8568.1 / gene=MONOS_8568 / organism=Monocercomonoides_exilis_PA203 / gene_product=unspecified product / transcript_product=unspecified product / location=Mono_scaffold00326:41082-41426(-) / protein_length=115 / sequence_SO=supercontig / SO=protein_coding / is_pseudo=false
MFFCEEQPQRSLLFQKIEPISYAQAKEFQLVDSHDCTLYLLQRIAWILQKKGMDTVYGTDIDTLVERMNKTTRLVININMEDFTRMYSKLSLFRRKANAIYTQQMNQEILTQIS